MALLAILLVSLLSLLFGYDECDIVFAGDAMMHQAQIDDARRPGGVYDFSDYFAHVDGYIMSADYAVVNLETPVSPAPYTGYPCFNAPGSYIGALKDAGFDLFLTANNHTLDRRDRGLRATVDSLEAYSVEHIGTYPSHQARQKALPLVKNINGIKVGFVNYTYGTNGISPGQDVAVDYIDRALIASDIAEARDSGAEIIIACIHWGDEYRLLPNLSQKSLADWLTNEQKVDAVIGGHPHVIQPMEMLTGGDKPQLVVYSLGNFISNMKTRDTRGGAMVKVTLRRGEDGIARVAEASYRLVFTEPPGASHGFRLRWADSSADPRAAAFSKAAREIFDKHNTGVDEDHPHPVEKLVGGRTF